jgi:hypothetical protein
MITLACSCKDSKSQFHVSFKRPGNQGGDLFKVKHIQTIVGIKPISFILLSCRPIKLGEENSLDMFHVINAILACGK